MIRTQLAVFLGVVVNPKTHEPVYVVKRNGTWRTVDIFLATEGSYESIGNGYLNDDSEWAKPTRITGLPRSHTPSGVRIKGGGFGTCLYTGLVLLASSGAEQLYDLGLTRTYGKGLGICSADDGRSASASAWWDSAYDRDLTSREEGESDTDEEPDNIEEEDVDLIDMLASRDVRLLKSMIAEFMNDRGLEGWVGDVTRVEGTVSRPDPDFQGTTEMTADVYHLKNAKEHHLIPIWDVLEGQWHQDPILQWARTPISVDDDRPDFVDLDALLALNVSQEGPLQVAQLANVARMSGADDAQIKAMMLSAQYGVDPALELAHAFARARVLEPDRLEPGAAGEPPDPAAWAEHGAAQAAALERAHGRVPETLRMNPPRRRNPGTPTRAEQRLLDERADEISGIREDLGWNDLADLP